MHCRRCGEEFADTLAYCPACKERAWREEKSAPAGHEPYTLVCESVLLWDSNRIHCGKCGHNYDDTLAECPYCKLMAEGELMAYCETCGRAYHAYMSACPHCKILDEVSGYHAPAIQNKQADCNGGEPPADYAGFSSWLVVLLLRILLGIVFAFANLCILKNMMLSGMLAGEYGDVYAFLQLLSIASCVLLIFLMFRRSRLFRPCYILNAVFVLFELASIFILHMQKGCTILDFAGTLLIFMVIEVIWITYLYQSKRCDAYFKYYVHTDPPKKGAASEQKQPEEAGASRSVL
ncbi:MAG: hypothetical protein ACYCX2_02030 [Christensenellales bacterium]